MIGRAGNRAFRGARRLLAIAGLALVAAASWGTRDAVAGSSAVICPAPTTGATIGVCGNLLSTLLGNLVGEATGNDVTGDIGNANAAALGSTPGGPPLGFAPVPASDPRYGKAIEALAYADKGIMTSAVPGAADWMAWGAVRGTFSSTRFANPYSGNQVNVTAGLGHVVNPDLVAGLFGGYENFDYTLSAVTGQLKGSGWTAGGYAGWRFLPDWRLDGALGYSWLHYDSSANGVTGSFNAGRWLTSLGATGTYRHGATLVEPSARIYALFENRPEWTDSLPAINPAQSVTIGRGSLGARMIYPAMTGMGTLSTYLGLYGDWRFGGSPALAGYEAATGLSARLTAGLGLTTPGGSRFSLDGEFGGIGASYTIWTVRGRAGVPF